MSSRWLPTTGGRVMARRGSSRISSPRRNSTASTSTTRTIAIALDRGRADSDFTERDRAILKLVRPHLMTAYGNAETVSALRRTAPTTSAAPETRRREIIVLRRNGQHLMSPRAGHWLHLYSQDGSSRGGHLPDDLSTGSGGSPCVWAATIPCRARRGPCSWRARTRASACA